MDKQITIRRAKVADLPILQELSKGLFLSDAPLDKDFKIEWPYSTEGKKYLLRRIRGRKGICLVVEVDGAIVGYATGGLLPVESWRPMKRSELDNIFIHKEFRSMGVGKRLLDTFSDWSSKKGVERILVHVMEGNTKGIHFYEKNKFYHHHIAMEKKLTKS